MVLLDEQYGGLRTILKVNYFDNINRNYRIIEKNGISGARLHSKARLRSQKLAVLGVSAGTTRRNYKLVVFSTHRGHQLTHAIIADNEINRTAAHLAILYVVDTHIFGIEQHGDGLTAVGAVNQRLLKLQRCQTQLTRGFEWRVLGARASAGKY